MTTIAYKDGILAADTQLTIDGSYRMKCKKITHVNEYTTISCAGNVDDEIRAIRYFEKPNWKDEEPPKLQAKKFECIVIFGTDVYFCNGNLYPIPLQDEFISIGSGWLQASEAMKNGMTAKQAVQVAAQTDVFTNNVVDTFDVRTQKTPPKIKKSKTTG